MGRGSLVAVAWNGRIERSPQRRRSNVHSKKFTGFRSTIRQPRADITRYTTEMPRAIRHSASRAVRTIRHIAAHVARVSPALNRLVKISAEI
jgi:hypothetical protein